MARQRTSTTKRGGRASQQKKTVEQQEQKQTKESATGESEQDQRREEIFVASGRKDLPRRVKKFVEWREDVLKDEDIENVHRMRVASRRLRATMDAYEVACKPGPFKKAYRSVRKAADLLGTVRDTDVMLQHIQEQEQQMPTQEQAGMQWLVERLQVYRREQVEALNSFLQDFDDAALKQEIETSIEKGASSHGKSQTH
jgi:CHAD domain-containing protein